jgi:hypothetical protein
MTNRKVSGRKRYGPVSLMSLSLAPRMRRYRYKLRRKRFEPSAV